MLRIFYKNDGAISVFLSLILLPVLLVGCLTVDGARIYMSKAVISDAGEMAMNAALAQYQPELKDEYGLLAMEKSSESISGDLEKYFLASLNGTGIEGADSYDKILNLVGESFEAVNVEASKLYKTEVEKQQILEYMKYRAPVCFAELILEKMDQLKETKKMLAAMEAQMEFSKAMEDCQDAFDVAKEALDALNADIENFPNQNTIQDELDETQRDYTLDMARCFLMRAAISYYNDYDVVRVQTDTWQVMKEAAESFVSHAQRVDMNNVSSQTVYNDYISALYYKNTIDRMAAVNGISGIAGLLIRYDAGENPSEQERQTLVDLVNSYNEQKNRIAGYSNSLLQEAKNYVNDHYSVLNSYWCKARDGADIAKEAAGKLEDVKKKLEKASQEYDKWETATNQLSDPGSMKDELEDYRDMFDTHELEVLKYNVETDEQYFDEIRDVIAEETFYGQSIATTPSGSQSNKYNSEANYVMSGRDNYYYDGMEFVRIQTYITDYHHIYVNTSNRLVHIENDPFYQKLIEYCEREQTEESETAQENANGQLEEGIQGIEDLVSEEDYPDFDWSSAGVTLPTSVLGGNSSSSENFTDIEGGDIGKKSERRDIIAKVQQSIEAASGFIDGLNRILASGIENLYIAEYGMQLFSYYTVNKEVVEEGGTKNIKELENNEVFGMSGFPLAEHPAYRAETEYILWGNNSSAKNISSTVGVIFGIRLLFNCFFAFTNIKINADATQIATAIAGGAPYLIPIIKIVFKTALAILETTLDVSKIKEGYGITITKDASSWATYVTGRGTGDNTKGITLDYSEFLRIFLNTNMLVGGEVGILGRIADCIQVNQKGTCDIMEMYTMVAVDAKVKTRTTFMRKIADLSRSVWEYDDTYSISYQSVLGY